MVIHIFRWMRLNTTIFWVILSAGFVQAEPQHGISMYGAPALPADFAALPYVNPDAPKGGQITLGNTGGFDSLNPYVRKGTVPWQLRFFTHDTLMGRSWDEPFALYGLLAETIETPPDRSWVEFTLREGTTFSDGSPLGVEDVIFSYELLGTQGHPRYHGLWKQIESIEQTGPRKVRLTFNTDNRELALLAGMRPILSRAQWEGKDFANAPLQDVPLGSGPYVVSDFKAGDSVTLTRNPDYWGKDVPFMQGQSNFDQIKIDFYGDSGVMFEAFKAGAISAVREFNVETWNTNYNFAAAQSGKVVKSSFPHQKPSGMTGFVMNTRVPPFDDWRVRDALTMAFNFEYINETITGGALPRISSYFSTSSLAMAQGPATGQVADLLAPYAGDLTPGTLEGYELPISNGTVRNRKGLREASSRLKEAGFRTIDGVLTGPDGTPFKLSILLETGSRETAAIAQLYAKSLERLGIEATVESIDNAQYVERTTSFDFQMTSFRRAVSLSPGNEQRYYWGTEAADQPGSRNLMGVKSPAIDAMIDTMLSAKSSDDFVAATKAMDRVLTAGRYVIPFWQFNEGLIAHDARMKYPGVPIYGDGAQYMPHVWWWQE